MTRKLMGSIGVLILLFAASCGDATKTSSPRPAFAVGTYSQTWVDTSRPTQRNGTAPELPSRTIRTLYMYPATGDAHGDPVQDAAPDKSSGPYPLLVFAHGFGASPELHKDQISALAPWDSWSRRRRFR